MNTNDRNILLFLRSNFAIRNCLHSSLVFRPCLFLNCFEQCHMRTWPCAFTITHTLSYRCVWLLIYLGMNKGECLHSLSDFADQIYPSVKIFRLVVYISNYLLITSLVWSSLVHSSFPSIIHRIPNYWLIIDAIFRRQFVQSVMQRGSFFRAGFTQSSSDSLVKAIRA